MKIKLNNLENFVLDNINSIEIINIDDCNIVIKDNKLKIEDKCQCGCCEKNDVSEKKSFTDKVIYEIVPNNEDKKEDLKCNINTEDYKCNSVTNVCNEKKFENISITKPFNSDKIKVNYKKTFKAPESDKMDKIEKEFDIDINKLDKEKIEEIIFKKFPLILGWEML